MRQHPPRPTRMRSLAERVATDPRMLAEVSAALAGVMVRTVPGLLHEYLKAECERQFGTLRLHDRKIPDEVRQARDDRVRALLATGMAPELVALECGCSRRHVYNVRRLSAALCKTLP